MALNEPRELVDLLKGIEQRSRAHVIGMPQQEEGRYWQGLLFKALDRQLVAPLNEVVEILHSPPVVTRVPGTHPWFLGIANIRGNLLSLIDLDLFLGGNPVCFSRRSRVLVIKHREIYAGLLVEEVGGMRRFLMAHQSDGRLPEGPLKAYVKNGFKQDDETWPVFSMHALAENPEFRVAAF